MTVNDVQAVVADYLHNYPDFKRDFTKGFLLGEHEGVYYFWNNGVVGTTELYNVSNNISNFFSGPIISSNGVRYYPAKMVLEAFVREQTLEAFEGEGQLELSSKQPYTAEILCLETLRRIEEVLPLSDGINGWSHFVIRLENLAVQNKGKIVQIEGIDHYLFISEESLVLQFATADDVHTFKWKFDSLVKGFKVSKKLMVKLIERQKFSV